MGQSPRRELQAPGRATTRRDMLSNELHRRPPRLLFPLTPQALPLRMLLTTQRLRRRYCYGRDRCRRSFCFRSAWRFVFLSALDAVGRIR